LTFRFPEQQLPGDYVHSIRRFNNTLTQASSKAFLTSTSFLEIWGRKDPRLPERSTSLSIDILAWGAPKSALQLQVYCVTLSRGVYTSFGKFFTSVENYGM
jgi:hypothetical protein